MLKLQLRDFIFVNSAGSVILNEGITKLMGSSLPVKIAYEFGKLIKKLSEETVLFSERRNALIMQYGAKDETTGIFSVDQKSEAFVAFSKDYMELLSIEVTVEFEPMSIDSLGSISLSALDMILLEKFIKVE